jgi:hypothetical protein
MKRGPIGVWFSAALVLLGLSAWGGSVSGKKFAGYWYRHRMLALQQTYSPERVRMETEMSELRDIGISHTFLMASYSDKKIWNEYLQNRIDVFEKAMHQPIAEEVRPVPALELGLAYVDAAMVEEKDNEPDGAAKNMKSAQAIFQSLGWKDYSEAALTSTVRSEFDKWNPHPQERRSVK